MKVTMDESLEDVEDVLLVEDNPGDVRLIREAFKASDLDPTIHATRTRDEAIDVLFRRNGHEAVPRPDLVLLDWRLSEQTGDAVLEAAKSGERSIPVVVMTGSRRSLDRVEASAPAADGYVAKQTAPETYVDVLRSCWTDT